MGCLEKKNFAEDIGGVGFERSGDPRRLCLRTLLVSWFCAASLDFKQYSWNIHEAIKEISYKRPMWVDSGPHLLWTVLGPSSD